MPNELNAVEGEILRHDHNFNFVVRLADDREIIATLPKNKLRKLGCFFGFGHLAGHCVEIVFPPEPKMPRIVSIRAPEMESGIG